MFYGTQSTSKEEGARIKSLQVRSLTGILALWGGLKVEEKPVQFCLATLNLVSHLLSECLHVSLLLTYGIVINMEQGIDCIIIQDSQANAEHAQREGTVRWKGMCKLHVSRVTNQCV